MAELVRDLPLEERPQLHPPLPLHLAGVGPVQDDGGVFVRQIDVEALQELLLRDPADVYISLFHRFRGHGTLLSQGAYARLRPAADVLGLPLLCVRSGSATARVSGGTTSTPPSSCCAAARSTTSAWTTSPR